MPRVLSGLKLFVVNRTILKVLFIPSAQSPVAKAKDSELLIANLKMDRHVPDVTKTTNHLSKRTVTSDRVRIG